MKRLQQTLVAVICTLCGMDAIAAEPVPKVSADFVRSCLPADETATRKNNAVAHTYEIRL